MKMRYERMALLVLLGLSLSACVDRGAPGGQNNANNNANTNSNSNTNSNTNSNSNNNQGECNSADDCVVALKYDECCACPRPASQADMAADPCLLPLGTEEIPDQCQVVCPAMPCEECRDAGRTVTCREGRCEWFEGHCDRDDDCVVGIWTDDCCTAAIPVTKDDIAQDQCLQYWPIQDGIIPQACQDKWDPQCAYVDCAPQPPWSRAVACQETEEGKMCELVPECESNDDCAVLIDMKACCPCPEAWPVAMKSHDPCLVASGEQAPSGCQPLDCPEMPCPACMDANAVCQDQQCVSVTFQENEAGR